VGFSVRRPKTRQNFGKRQKFGRDFWTQRVYQGILKTQRLIEMNKGKARENGQGKTPKTTKQWVASPLEWPILLSD
jgi:hypothetical protein